MRWSVLHYRPSIAGHRLPGRASWSGVVTVFGAKHLNCLHRYIMIIWIHTSSGNRQLPRKSHTHTHTHVCMAACVCCVYALRCGGRDPSITEQLQNDPELCDHIVSDDGQLVTTVDTNGDLLPFAQRMVDIRHRQLQREHQKRHKQWWQFRLSSMPCPHKAA